MTKQHPTTPAEVQEAIRSPEWQRDRDELIRGEANPNEYPTLYEATLRRMRRRWGPALVDALIEWLES